MHDQGVVVGISQLVRYDAVFAVPGGGGSFAIQGLPVIVKHSRGIRSISDLQIGEGAAIGHNVLKRCDIRIVESGVVPIAQHAVCQRKPDFGNSIAGSAQTVCWC